MFIADSMIRTFFFSSINSHLKVCTSAWWTSTAGYLPNTSIQDNFFKIPIQDRRFTDSSTLSSAQNSNNLGVNSHTVQPLLVCVTTIPSWLSSRPTFLQPLQLIQKAAACLILIHTKFFHFSPRSLSPRFLILNSAPRLSFPCVPSSAMTSPPLTGLHSCSLSPSLNWKLYPTEALHIHLSPSSSSCICISARCLCFKMIHVRLVFFLPYVSFF